MLQEFAKLRQKIVLVVLLDSLLWLIQDFRTGDKPGFGDLVVTNLVDCHEFDHAGTFGECPGDAFVIDNDVAEDNTMQKRGVKHGTAIVDGARFPEPCLALPVLTFGNSTGPWPMKQTK